MSKHIYTTRATEEVFVLYLDGQPIHVQKSGWTDWTPPKKIYSRLGDAKRGIANLPKFIDRSKVTIVRYVPEIDP